MRIRSLFLIFILFVLTVSAAIDDDDIDGNYMIQLTICFYSLFLLFLMYEKMLLRTIALTNVTSNAEICTHFKNGTEVCEKNIKVMPFKHDADAEPCIEKRDAQDAPW